MCCTWGRKHTFITIFSLRRVPQCHVVCTEHSRAFFQRVETAGFSITGDIYIVICEKDTNCRLPTALITGDLNSADSISCLKAVPPQILATEIGSKLWWFSRKSCWKQAQNYQWTVVLAALWWWASPVLYAFPATTTNACEWHSPTSAFSPQIILCLYLKSSYTCFSGH